MIEFLVSVFKAFRLFIATVGIIALVEPLNAWDYFIDFADGFLAFVQIEISYKTFLAASISFYHDLADEFFFWIPALWRDGALLAVVLFGISALSFVFALPSAMLAVTKRRVLKEQIAELSEATGLDERGETLRVAFEEKYGSMTRGDLRIFLEQRIRDLGFKDFMELRGHFGSIHDELASIPSSDDILRQRFVGFSLSGYLIMIGVLMLIFAANFINYQQYMMSNITWVYLYALPIAFYFIYQMMFKTQIERGFPLNFCRGAVLVLALNLMLWMLAPYSWISWGLVVTAFFLIGFSFARIRLF